MAILPHQKSFERANFLQQSGRTAEAYDVYEKIFPHYKNNSSFLLRMAYTAISLGRDQKAKKLLESTLKLAPKSAVTYNLLGAIYLRRIEREKALQNFRKYVELEPDNVKARLNLGKVLLDLNRPEDAAHQYTKASELDPASPLPLYWIAVIHRAMGQMDLSTSFFRKALTLKQNYAGAWKQLAELKQLDLETDLPKMLESLDSLSELPREQAKVHFALSMALDNNKDYEKSYSHLEIANKIIKQNSDYEVINDGDFMRRIAETFTVDLHSRLENHGSSSDKMIFIVGMPRSGTTLVEQIVSGHSLVYAGGELPYVEDALDKAGQRHGFSYPETANRWSKKDLKKIADHYLQSVDTLNKTSPYITDKLPTNFLYLGAIKAVFPKARILHCTRDPIDTCLGNYRQLFTKGMDFAYSQEDLVHYYKSYSALMEHWHKLFGEDILDVSYETLVQNFEGEAKKIISHCNLTWEAGCIDTHNSKRAVYTASASQVREGVHENYVNRWKNYQPYIETMIKGLEGL